MTTMMTIDGEEEVDNETMQENTKSIPKGRTLGILC